jgi:hypothetical protein
MTCCGRHGEEPSGKYKGRDVMMRIQSECDSIMKFSGWCLQDIGYLRNMSLYTHVYNDGIFDVQKSYDQIAHNIEEFINKSKTLLNSYYKPVIELRTLSRSTTTNDLQYHKDILKKARTLYRTIETDYKNKNDILQALPVANIDFIESHVLINNLNEIIVTQQNIIKAYRSSNQ